MLSLSALTLAFTDQKILLLSAKPPPALQLQQILALQFVTRNEIVVQLKESPTSQYNIPQHFPPDRNTLKRYVELKLGDTRSFLPSQAINNEMKQAILQCGASKSVRSVSSSSLLEDIEAEYQNCINPDKHCSTVAKIIDEFIQIKFEINEVITLFDEKSDIGILQRLFKYHKVQKMELAISIDFAEKFVYLDEHMPVADVLLLLRLNYCQLLDLSMSNAAVEFLLSTPNSNKYMQMMTNCVLSRDYWAEQCLYSQQRLIHLLETESIDELEKIFSQITSGCYSRKLLSAHNEVEIKAVYDNFSETLNFDLLIETIHQKQEVLRYIQLINMLIAVAIPENVVDTAVQLVSVTKPYLLEHPEHIVTFVMNLNEIFTQQQPVICSFATPKETMFMGRKYLQFRNFYFLLTQCEHIDVQRVQSQVAKFVQVQFNICANEFFGSNWEGRRGRANNALIQKLEILHSAECDPARPWMSEYKKTKITLIAATSKMPFQLGLSTFQQSNSLFYLVNVLMNACGCCNLDTTWTQLQYNIKHISLMRIATQHLIQSYREQEEANPVLLTAQRSAMNMIVSFCSRVDDRLKIVAAECLLRLVPAINEPYDVWFMFTMEVQSHVLRDCWAGATQREKDGILSFWHKVHNINDVIKAKSFRRAEVIDPKLGIWDDELEFMRETAASRLKMYQGE